MRIKQVDSFTSEPFSGNPAAVVIRADNLGEEQMQLVAREMNLSETCFVSSSSREGIDFSFRWFTPITEVDACGHATLAALHALGEEALIPLSDDTTLIKIETKSGIWKARIWLRENSPMVMFSMLHGSPSFEAYPFPLTELAEALKVDIDEMGIGGHKPEIMVANYRQLIVPVGSMESLEHMKPDFGYLSKILGTLNTSMHLFTLETVDESSDVHSRHFAPNYGIDEDPVTGAGNAALFAYLVARNLVEAREPVTFLIGEQGHIIGRAGYVKGEVHLRDSEITHVEIGGDAVTIMNAEMDIPV